MTLSDPKPTRAAALLLLALLASLALLAAVRAAPVRANVVQGSIMMDDDLLLYRGDATRDATLTQMRVLGADYVRVTMLWRVVADGATSQGRRFKPSNPATYPPHNWDRFDRLVLSAQRLGLGVYFDVTGPGPGYGHGVAPPSLRARVGDSWMPKPRAFYQFVTAVGKRYSGAFRVHRQLLPHVGTWSLWNEPNQGGWITPQWRQMGGQLIPYSPILYRQLFLYGRQALQNTGHGRDQLLLGETAPNGLARHTATSAIDPKTFIRELLCADDQGRPLDATAAALRGCSVFARFGNQFYAAGYAHHPYTKFLAPSHPDPNPNAITIANIAELPALLDQLAAGTGHLRAGMPIISSEFGYQTNPPNPFFGISLDRQAEYINEGDYLAYLSPRVFAQTQFQLRDSVPARQFPRGSKQYFSTYDAGLEFLRGTPKPSQAAYVLPLVALTDGPVAGPSSIRVWGQLRFLAHDPRGGAVQAVQIEYRRPGAPPTAFAPLGGPLAMTDGRRHFFTGSVAVPGPGTIRAHWSGGGLGPDHYSRAVPIA